MQYVLFLTGCRNGISNHSNEETKKKNKNKIEVYSAQNDTYATTIDDQNTINQVLDIRDWEEVKRLPDDLKPNYTMIVYQNSSYIQEIISSDVVHNMIIPEDVMTFYYVISDESRKKLEQIQKLNFDLSKVVLQQCTERFCSVLFLYFLGQNIEQKTFLRTACRKQHLNNDYLVKFGRLVLHNKTERTDTNDRCDVQLQTG